MIHHMSLAAVPFESIKSGSKGIEIRLFDEKRQKIHDKDTIVFAKMPNKKEKLIVEVMKLSVFPSFRELFTAFDKAKFGHQEARTIEDQIAKQREYYTAEEEKRYGVVGIHIKLVDRL
jgi:ASC-1-like (ASCH) protein